MEGRSASDRPPWPCLVIFYTSIFCPVFEYLCFFVIFASIFCRMFYRNVHFFICRQRFFLCDNFLIFFTHLFFVSDLIFSVFRLNLIHRFIVSYIGGNYHGFLYVEGNAASNWPPWPCFFWILCEIISCPTRCCRNYRHCFRVRRPPHPMLGWGG